MAKIDKKDLKLLSVIDMNARITIPVLAKRIGVSRQVAEYRLNKLIKNGAIQGTRAVYDHRKLGKHVYRVLFRLYQSPKQSIDEFAEYIIKNYDVMWAAKLGGGWDLVVNFVAKDTQTFDDQFAKITEQKGKIIQQYHMLTYVNITDCHRGYLTGKKEKEYFIHSMRGPEEKIDKEDTIIIKELGDNCRETNINIGKKAGLTGNAVRYRIRRYKKEKILLGFRTILDPNKIGYKNNLVLLTINNLSAIGEKSLYEYLMHHNNVTFIVKHIGAFRIAFEIETKTSEELEETIRIIRTIFSDLVNDVRVYPVLKEYTATYNASISPQ